MDERFSWKHAGRFFRYTKEGFIAKIRGPYTNKLLTVLWCYLALKVLADRDGHCLFVESVDEITKTDSASFETLSSVLDSSL